MYRKVQEESMKEYSEGGNDILEELRRLQKERETLIKDKEFQNKVSFFI